MPTFTLVCIVGARRISRGTALGCAGMRSLVEVPFPRPRGAIQGGVIRQAWAGWDVDFTKGITFKAAGK
jgi:hypothetical protein